MKRPLLIKENLCNIDDKTLLSIGFHPNPWIYNKHKYKHSKFLRRVFVIISETQRQNLSGDTKQWFTSTLIKSNTHKLYRTFISNTGEMYYIIVDYITIGSEDLDAKINYLTGTDRTRS